ncbi:hypothetical protein LINPERPRIM_LOCUS13003 [Linum perenne]
MMMDDGRGGCCIARYAGGGGRYEYVDMSKMHRIMLRFRPIAPKPAKGPGSSSGGSSPDLSDVTSKSRPARGRKRNRNNNPKGSDSKRSCQTSRRSYNRKAAGCCKEENAKRTPVAEAEAEGRITTLPLLPESPDGCGTHVLSPAADGKDDKKTKTTAWLNFGDQTVRGNTGKDYNNNKVVMGSCVTVECVSRDTWVDSDELGRTDEEKRLRLAMDTCPGIISDVYGRVTWTNEAYRKMVMMGVEDDEDEEEMAAVWLMTKWKTAVTAATVGCERAFSCRVRVQYEMRNNNDGKVTRGSITVPCDVWGMGSGGFAWRLDINAALSLGR